MNNHLRKKILIVEDNPDLVDVLRLQVNELGYESIVAMNGREAVDMAADQMPDLIMLDIMLPDMNGLEAARLIRKNPDTQSIPILAVTARVLPKVKEQCLENGCDDYISKPFLHNELLPRIEKLLKSSDPTHRN